MYSEIILIINIIDVQELENDSFLINGYFQAEKNKIGNIDVKILVNSVNGIRPNKLHSLIRNLKIDDKILGKFRLKNLGFNEEKNAPYLFLRLIYIEQYINDSQLSLFYETIEEEPEPRKNVENEIQ